MHEFVDEGPAGHGGNGADGGLEEILTGWVMGRLPDGDEDADAFEAFEESQGLRTARCHRAQHRAGTAQGDELAQHLVNAQPEAKVLYLSGAPCLPAHAQGTLVEKPVDLEVLVELINLTLSQTGP